jgi:phosphate transport system permease protein
MRQNVTDRLILVLFGSAAAISCLAVVAVFLFLLRFSWPLFSAQGLGEVMHWTWQPFKEQFGILPMIVGTLGLAATAMGLAFPLAVGVCCFIHGMGPRLPARITYGLIQFMTSIPTVIYGFVAVFLLVPRIRTVFHHGTGFSWLAAALVLALLILPTMVLMLHTQFTLVEPRVRLTAKALGMTEAQKFVHMVFPLSRRGFLAAGVLGFGRAAGDTLIPLMLAGNAVMPPESLLDSIRTLTAHIALVVATDSQSGAYLSLFACGMILFLTTVGVNAGLRFIAGQDDGRGIIRGDEETNHA